MREERDAREPVLPAEPEELRICEVCGYAHKGRPPPRCPSCDAPGDAFRRGPAHGPSA